MTVEEFMEFFGGSRYIFSSDTRALLNTDTILDTVNYRGNIFDIALQHLVHDTAAHQVTNQVYRDVLLKEFTSVFQKDPEITKVLELPAKWDLHEITDENVWKGVSEGEGAYPGLYRLTHARCLSVLISEPSETPLAVPPHPDVYTPENLANRYAIPAPWFFKAAERLRNESLLHFRAAAVAIYYHDDRKVTHDWMADALGIEEEENDLLSILRTAKLIIQGYLDEDVRVSRGNADTLASRWENDWSRNL